MIKYENLFLYVELILMFSFVHVGSFFYVTEVLVCAILHRWLQTWRYTIIALLK